MKTFTIATTVTPTLALIAWLLVPQTAHCFYNSSTGRWLSRDPIGQRGGKNLYGFVGNQPTLARDYLGLKICIRSIVETDPTKAAQMFDDPEDYGTKENFVQNYNTMKQALEKALQKLKDCCKSHPKDLADISICSFLDDGPCHYLTIVPRPKNGPVDVASGFAAGVTLGIPAQGPAGPLDHEIYTDNGDGTYSVTLQTYEPILTHEFQHHGDCCKSTEQQPPVEFPSTKEGLKLKDLFKNPSEKSATDAENKLRCYCTELKLPIRSRYAEPPPGSIFQ